MARFGSGNPINPRVTVLALNLGMSFSILALYVSNLVIIFLVVLLLTSSIVAASTGDLTILKEDKTLIGVMIAFAISVFLVAAWLFSFVGPSLFYGLIATDVGFLLAYVVMRRTARRSSKNGTRRINGR